MSEPTCAECSCGLIQQRTWVAASHQLRAHWASTGHRILKGHGLCANCYQRAYRRGGFPFSPVVKDEASVVAPCRRCGMPGTPGLCNDCSDVAADLNETARWVA